MGKVARSSAAKHGFWPIAGLLPHLQVLTLESLGRSREKQNRNGSWSCAPPAATRRQNCVRRAKLQIGTERPGKNAPAQPDRSKKPQSGSRSAVDGDGASARADYIKENSNLNAEGSAAVVIGRFPFIVRAPNKFGRSFHLFRDAELISERGRKDRQLNEQRAERGVVKQFPT